MTMVEADLKEKEGKWRKLEKEAGDGTKSLEIGKKAVTELNGKLRSTGWSAEKEQDLAMRAREAREQVRTLSEVGP
jgi:structural maintenance of chromosome 2